MLNWFKKLFSKKDPFDKFLKQLVKERREVKYDTCTDDTGPH